MSLGDMEAISFDLSTKTLKRSTREKIPTVTEANDVVVEVAYSGICGTDLHIVEGTFPCNDERPFILGHEFCGTVKAAGAAAHFKPGQRVVVDPNSGCGVCVNCHSGKYHLCESGGILSTVGIWKDGGWADYCKVPDTQVFLLPDSITFEQSALCEPLSCLARGWDRAGPIAVGSDILIVGAGIIGNLWSIVLHFQGHRNVTVAELNSNRLEMARKMNLGYKYEHPESVKSSGTLFDVIVDCTGVAKVVEDTMPLLKRSGRYVIFGCSNPKHSARINPFEIYYKESTIIGVNINPFTFPKAIGFLESMGDRYLNYERLGIKVFSLKQYEEAFEQLKSGQISKAVFKLK